jgi:hypothetical protein
MSTKRKYSLTDKDSLKWANQHPSVLTYLSKINAYKKRAATDIYLFCEWAGKTPEELLAMKTGYEDLRVERLLDKFAYSEVDFPETRKWQITQKVRGFFRKNYKALASGAGKMEYPNSTVHHHPSKARRRRFYEAAYNPRDRAIVALCSCTGLALETLDKLKWSHFEEDWQIQEIPHISIPSEMLKGKGKGKYRGTRQETFLTPEAKKLLIEYRRWYSETFGKQWTPDDYVLLQTKRGIGKPLDYAMIAKAMLKMSKRSGVAWSSHDGRRILQTALESVGTPNNWIKKFKGRKVSGEESPYSKPAIEKLRAKYTEALPELEFLSEVDQNAIARAEADIEELKLKNEALKNRLDKLTRVRDQSDVLMSQIMQDDRFQALIMKIMSEQNGVYEARDDVKVNGKVVDVKIHRLKKEQVKKALKG